MNIDKIKNDPRLPQHMGIIIDGNGRWAKSRGLPRSAGHKAGSDNLKKQIEFLFDLGVKNLSLYCFSSENWKRPKQEVDYLMQLFDEMLDEYKKDYIDRDVKIIISGDLSDERLPINVRTKAKELINLTSGKTSNILNLYINYGGRQEILKAVNELVKLGEEVDEKTFEKHLYTYGMLPLDFIIRTSGEKRSSNFLPWQATYSEWEYPKKCWPSFSKRDMIKAIKSFMSRNRRFGGLSKNEKKNNN